MMALGGRSIATESLLPDKLGDEVAVVVTPPGGDRDHTDTRALVRLGRITAGVVIQDRDPRDVSADVAALVSLLTQRVVRLAGSTR